MGLLIMGSIMMSSGRAEAQDACRISVLTGYSAQQYPGRTADGTSTWGALASEDYIAAGPRWMLGRRIHVQAPDGVLIYRIADTGLLAEHGIDYDLLFATTAEARQWGVRRLVVCVER